MSLSLPPGLQRWLRHKRGLPAKLLYMTGIRSVKNLALPDFLCLGAQKGGTTWLFNNLNHHPDVYIPPSLAPHFDAQYFTSGFHRSLASYAALFEPAGDRKKGECTPAYGLLSDERIRFVRAVMPEVRLLLIIRNPVERAWSHATMNLVRQDGKPFDEVSEQAFFDHFTSPGSRGRSDYAAMLDRWGAHFPSDHIHVCFFDDMVDRPRALLEGVFKHLGLTTDVDWSSYPYQQVFNRGLAVEMPDAYRTFLEELYHDEIEELARRFGDKVAAWRRWEKQATSCPE